MFGHNLRSMVIELSSGIKDLRELSRKPLSGHNLSSATSALDSLIAIACDAEASDLHLDPTETVILVRIRIDGHLESYESLPKKIHLELIARIKVLAGLRTDEHFTPQDGRFYYTQNDGSRIDIRLSIAPTYYGENAVLRFLAPTRHALSNLGFSNVHEAQLADLLSRSHGMLLVSGPTGSGKTTTLYSLLRLIAQRPLSLVTIEDPIEYSIDGAVQIQARKGFSFADGLRSILRQDPDVIMVGEIRDEETAGLATNAALTGHLVFSTLHANDAPGVLLRLMDLKVEPFLITSTISLIVAQRLVRKVCVICAIEEEISLTEYNQLSRLFDTEIPKRVVRGGGCDECDGSGYRGRIGIYELMEINQEMREAVLAKVGAEELRMLALTAGMAPLLADGLSKVVQGLTTFEEILRTRYA